MQIAVKIQSGIRHSNNNRMTTTTTKGMYRETKTIANAVAKQISTNFTKQFYARK